MVARYIDADEFVKRVIQYPRQSTKTIGLALADTPTADVVETPKWIPVSERLPENHRSAIVTDFGHVTLAYTNNLGEWMDYDGNKLKNVTAWMPLPEPYRDADMR